MKTISRFVFGLSLILLIACESEEQPTTAYGDAFLIVKTTEQDTLIGLALHAYANKNFQSVSASPVENVDVSYDLSKKVYQNNFYYETAEENYGTELPETGDYNFSAVVENNENVTFLDELTDDLIYPPVIITLEYNVTDEQIDIEWEEDEDVDIYGVSVYNDQDGLVFLSQSMDGSETDFSIDENTNGWASGISPENGKTYTIQLDAFLYETIKTDMNVQCRSFLKQEVIWGE